jgi:hypothetical protein
MTNWGHFIVLVFKLLLCIRLEHRKYILFHKLSHHFRRDLISVKLIIFRICCTTLSFIFRRFRLLFLLWLECRARWSLIIVCVHLYVLRTPWSYASCSGLCWLYSIILLIQKWRISRTCSSSSSYAFLSYNWFTLIRWLKSGSTLSRIASSSRMSLDIDWTNAFVWWSAKTPKPKVRTHHGIFVDHRILKLRVVILHHSV